MANRNIDGAAKTVGWHDDYFMLTHANFKMNDGLARWFDVKYGKRIPFVVEHVLEHEYLGMNIDLCEQGRVRITMFSYITEMLLQCQSKFAATSITPASNHPFETSDEDFGNDKARTAKFHYITAKTLFLVKRAMPDSQLAV